MSAGSAIRRRLVKVASNVSSYRFNRRIPIVLSGTLQNFNAPNGAASWMFNYKCHFLFLNLGMNTTFEGFDPITRLICFLGSDELKVLSDSLAMSYCVNGKLLLKSPPSARVC